MLTGIGVACTTASYSLGGTASGVTGAVLIKNGADLRSINANGTWNLDDIVAEALARAGAGPQPPEPPKEVPMSAPAVTDSNEEDRATPIISVPVPDAARRPLVLWVEDLSVSFGGVRAGSASCGRRQARAGVSTSGVRPLETVAPATA